MSAFSNWHTVCVWVSTTEGGVSIPKKVNGDRAVPFSASRISSVPADDILSIAITCHDWQRGRRASVRSAACCYAQSLAKDEKERIDLSIVQRMDDGKPIQCGCTLPTVSRTPRKFRGEQRVDSRSGPHYIMMEAGTPAKPLGPPSCPGKAWRESAIRRCDASSPPRAPENRCIAEHLSIFISR